MSVTLALLFLFWVLARPWVGLLLGITTDALVGGAALLQWLSDSNAFALHADWLNIPTYMLCGVLLFLCSVYVTCESRLLYLFCPIVFFPRRQGWGFVRVVALAPIHEELLWRVAAQSLLNPILGTFPSVILVAFNFTWWHRSRTGANWRLQAEFLVFALILGASFALSGDPLLVISLHAVRNFFIFTKLIAIS